MTLIKYKSSKSTYHFSYESLRFGVNENWEIIPLNEQQKLYLKLIDRKPMIEVSQWMTLEESDLEPLGLK